MTKIAETRPATQSDFEFAWKLYSDSVRPMMEQHILRERNESWSHDEEKSRFAKIWDPAKVLIVTCDNEPIGWLSVAKSGDTVHLENFYIEAKYRSKGLGSALLSWLIGQHKNTMFVTSLITGSRSRSLYERVGFAEKRKVRFET